MHRKEYLQLTIYVVKDSELHEFLKSKREHPDEPLGHVANRLLREYMSILYYQQNSRRIKRSIKRQLREKRGLMR